MKTRFDQSLNELEGYLELGMAQETLTVAKAILKQRPLTSHAFAQAIQALLIQADNLKPWTRLIERAYEALDRKARKHSASSVLYFYVSIRAWKKASGFVPKRTNDPTELLFSMWTWLELKEMEKAHPLCRKCRRQLQATNPGDELAVGSLLEALGSYYAQTGDWHLAEQAWKSGQDYSPFAENAWDGLVKLHAYRGLLQANVAFDSARANIFSDDDNLMLPGNSAGRCAWIDKKFHRPAKYLARVIPAKERWRFGR